jgi:hypothetical protein
MRVTSWLGAITLCCWAVGPALALAQHSPSSSSAPHRDGRFEVSGAVGWAGSSSLGVEQATLTGNGVPTGGPIVFFEAASSIQSGLTFDGRLAVRVSRTFAIEGSGGITRSDLRTRVTGDIEGADPIVLTEQVRQFTVEAGLLAHLHKLSWAGGRIVPFVTGGGGYLRQLHDGRTLATDGASGYVGGGIKYAWHERPRGWAKAIGLRADVRLRLHSGGFDLGDDRVRIHPNASAGVYLRF